GLAVLVGLPLGIWLFTASKGGLNSNQVEFTASKGGLNSNQVVYRVLSFIVDVTRSIPFIILIIALIPFARFVVGSALGWQATVVSLTIGAIPFYARLVENSLREVSEGKIEAALM